MKHCNEIQQALRDRFDCGEDVAEFAEEHVVTCDTCRAYRLDLAQLAHELGAIRMDCAPADLSARVIQHVQQRGADHSLRLADYVSIAIVAGVASVFAGWYMPAWVEPTQWWSQSSTWLIQADTTYSLSGLFDRFAALSGNFESPLSSIPMASQPVVWTALAVSCVGAIAFNGYMALRMRTAGD